MALYVSKSPELSLVVRRDVVANVVNTHGQTEAQSVVPVLYANFIPKALSGPHRTRADARFRQLNPSHPYGATPYSDPGIMGSQFNEEEISPAQPEAFVGFSPVHMLGKFDTATDINYSGQPEPEAEVRALVEKFLNDPAHGLDDIYILLDAVVLERPWPNYPLEGQGRHKTIEKHVREGGYDPRVIIMFEESQEHPGAGVISTMEALVAEFDAEQAEQDALGARIPG